jgi:small-conductance mechanosensitive channel
MGTWEDIRDRITEWAPDHVPDVITALVLVVVGYLVGRLLGRFTTRFLGAFSERIIGVVGRRTAAPAEHLRVEKAAASATGRIVFWVVFFLFLAAATSVVGSSVVDNWLDALALYLPRVLGAAAVLLLGVVSGHILRVVVLSAGTRAGRAYARPLAKTAQAAVVLVAAVVAIEGLGIETTFLVVLTAVGLAAVLGAVALAFGLGARDTVGDLVACHYLSRSYRVGHVIRVGTLEGRIVDILPTAVVLHTDAGRARVPARRFADEVTVLVAGEDE